jgi:hypothetical protein
VGIALDALAATTTITEAQPHLGPAVPVGPVRAGPFLPGAVGRIDGQVPPRFRATLRRRAAPGAVVSELADGKGWRWQDKLNDIGAGSFVLANDDPDVELVRASDLVVCEVDGAAAFTMLVREMQRSAVAGGEESAQLTTVAGPSSLAVLEEAVVYGARPLWCFPIENDRLFSWPAFDYDSSWWGRPAVLARYYESTYWGEDLGDSGYRSWPEDFPDHYGQWMWAPGTTWRYAPAGTCYFLATMNVPPGLAQIKVYLACDDVGHLFFDGQRIAEAAWSGGDTRTVVETVDVTPGLHILGIEATNQYNAQADAMGDLNPGGVLCTVYALNPAGALIEPPLLRSQEHWICLAYPPAPPGMKAGEAMVHVVREAQYRGALAGVTLAFNEHTDSAGRPWPLMGDIATKIGYDLLTFFKELANTYVDFAIAPGSLTLYAWVKGTRGRHTGVSLHPPTDPHDPDSGNLAQLDHKKLM